MTEQSDHSYVRKKSRKYGTYCYAPNCKAFQNQANQERKVTFHRFPNKMKEPERHRVWVRNCRRVDGPNRRTMLCSVHFTEEMIDRTGQIVRLRANAIPIIFDLPAHLQPVKQTPRSTKTAQKAMEVLELPVKNKQQEDTFANIQDHSYSMSDEQLRNKVKQLEQRVKELTKECKNAKIREKRAKGTMQNYLKNTSHVPKVVLHD